MSRLTRKFPTRRSSIDLPDTSALRERILEAVEQAIDRVEDVVSNTDVPSASDTAKRVRKTRAWEMAGTAVAAAGPTVVRAARNRHVRRHSTRAARIAPLAVRSHPVLLGVSLAIAAVAGFGIAKRLKARHASEGAGLLRAHDRYTEGVDSSDFSLTEEVSRMEDEGGDPGAYDGTPASRSRRFVRSGNGSDAASR